MTNTTNSGLKKFFSSTETVHKHWYTPVDGFQFATSDFYERIEKELASRKVPGLSLERLDLSEGGPLSAKREYLRLKRERLVFDICAAPFGTGFFFSFRFVELPFGVRLAELFVFALSLGLTAYFFIHLWGTVYGTAAFLTLCLLTVGFLRNAVALGLKDIDGTLLNAPLVGPVYELFFRKETYFREDTRLMYLTTVNEITSSLVEEFTAAKGVKLLKRFEQNSVSADLYRDTKTPLIHPAVDKAA